MAININDFLLQLGFDGSKVEKGLSDLQKKAERLARTITDKGQAALIKEVKAQQEAVKLQQQKVKLAEQQARANTQSLREQQQKNRLVEQEARARQKATREVKRSVSKIKLPSDPMASQYDVENRQARFRGIVHDTEQVRKQLAAKNLSDDELDRYNKLRDRLMANINSVKKLSQATTMSKLQLKHFNKAIAATSRQLSEYSKITRQARDQTTFMDRALGRAKGSLIQYAAGFGSIFLAVEGFTAVKDKTLELSQLKMALEVVERDLGGDFNDSLKKVTETADTLGIPLTTALEGFKNLRAAMGDKMAIEDVHDLNQSILGASKAMGLTADRTKLVVRAFSQMASKGKIQAEELNFRLAA